MAQGSDEARAFVSRHTRRRTTSIAAENGDAFTFGQYGVVDTGANLHLMYQLTGDYEVPCVDEKGVEMVCELRRGLNGPKQSGFLWSQCFRSFMCSTNGKSSGLTEEEIVVGGIGHVNLDDMKKIRRLLIIDNHELPKLDKEEVPQVEYLSVIDSCMHIAKVPRPDISYAIDVFSRHSSKPGQVHMAAAQDLVKYLYGSRELQIEYKRQKRDGNVPIVFEKGEEVPERTLDSRLQASTPNEIPGNPLLFVNADYAGCKVTRRSTSGMVIMMNGGPITWSSRLQKITAQSSAESEIHAVCEAVKEAIHIKLLCEETGIRASNKPMKALPREPFESFRGRMLVHSDND